MEEENINQEYRLKDVTIIKQKLCYWRNKSKRLNESEA